MDQNCEQIYTKKQTQTIHEVMAENPLYDLVVSSIRNRHNHQNDKTQTIHEVVAEDPLYQVVVSAIQNRKNHENCIKEKNCLNLNCCSK